MNAVVKTSNENYITEVEIPDEYLVRHEKSSHPVKLISMDDALEEHIKQVMKAVGNSVQKAAPILGVSERTLQRRLKAIRDKEEKSS